MLNKVICFLAPFYLRAPYIIDLYDNFRPTVLHEGNRHSNHGRVLTEYVSSNFNEDRKSRQASGGLRGIREECFRESDQGNEDRGEGPFSTADAKDGHEVCHGKYGRQNFHLHMPNGDRSDGASRVDSNMFSMDYSPYNSGRIFYRDNWLYYERMMTHLLSLAILFYSNNSYMEKMATQLPPNHYFLYNFLQQDINGLYENNISQICEDFYEVEKKEKTIESKGIEKYHFAFNRMECTLNSFLDEILRKMDSLHLSFESLPIEFSLRRNELIDEVIKSTPNEINDIYLITYKFFDSICSCLDMTSSFNFNYVSKKILSNLNGEGNFHRNVILEMKKINYYITNIHNNIVEYIKDLNSYFKNFFDYAARENLFCEPVLYSYSLFLDYYLTTMDQLMIHLNLHLRYPVSKDSQTSLNHIYKEIKTHANNLGCTIRRFYFKRNIKSDPEFSIIPFFADFNFRLRLADMYNNEKYANFIPLMINIIDYLRALVASIVSLVMLQTVYALLVDTENGHIKDVDAVKALTYLTEYMSHNSSLFAPPLKEKH
ncbi:erythrocyte vesicle protein 1, putative [Plasmodium knowlesi strain H]|uniref:Erythrocyte vesicle protein 1, putative n=3 Tax=Plasmodium knowlesi TaxID=5850 RepID=A0A5K1UVE5_PLAKH|nr:erythrocyte vesicle protein 1, putative [Plasmodium knowlesi strain H]OTN68541.1 putative Erythrocyte vesicle protein 1 [Plasmodium knowlesi]CAA9986509.1 erythrocyte vesicle protein 1, putative [Plasmodium knowlesi strain H]SBO24230.1 erythrocyte vesicle protein 1, putative [Plasmodium knowlesi strain H]SBO29756.1 erythrocyte vesicle protein 1, putative [Plasmodium knowlesi strain H]VVS75983.1 erythrocyte vesicle protein 1, putative [Plasmodium knowlesi strain H]|eukprot:XP_002261060.1 hypothetical protein, conserved in Plasmodium species [Plasmodium knowlesi strain H]